MWDVLNRTGPGIVTEQAYIGLDQDARDGTHDTLVLPPSYFYPLSTDFRLACMTNPNIAKAMVLPWTKGLHLWNSSWL